MADETKMDVETRFQKKLELLHEFCVLHGLEIWGATADNAFVIEERGDESGGFVGLRLFGVRGWDAEGRYNRDMLRSTAIPDMLRSTAIPPFQGSVKPENQVGEFGETIDQRADGRHDEKKL